MPGMAQQSTGLGSGPEVVPAAPPGLSLGLVWSPRLSPIIQPQNCSRGMFRGGENKGRDRGVLEEDREEERRGRKGMLALECDSKRQE